MERYETDSDTRALLTTCLELAMMTANLQISVADAKTVQDIVFQTAARFDIEMAHQPIEDVHQDGGLIMTETLPTTTTISSVDISNLPFKINVKKG